MTTDPSTSTSGLPWRRDTSIKPCRYTAQVADDYFWDIEPQQGSSLWILSCTEPYGVYDIVGTYDSVAEAKAAAEKDAARLAVRSVGDAE